MKWHKILFAIVSLVMFFVIYTIVLCLFAIQGKEILIDTLLARGLICSVAFFWPLTVLWLFYLLRLKNNKEKADLTNQLAHMDRLAQIGTITTGVVHEISTPLVILKTYLDSAMVRPVIDNATYKKMSDAIRNLTEISRNLRSYAKINREKYECIDTYEGISKTLSIIQQIYEDSGVIITTSIQKKLFINGSYIHLQQVLVNVISNAKDAILSKEESGEIKIKSSSDESHVFITITDNGPGISQDCSSKIFEPFFTTKPNSIGTGLGLSIVKTLVESMNGQISVRSDINKGATFIMAFPKVNKNT